MAIGLPTESGTARLVATCVLAAGFSGCTARTAAPLAIYTPGPDTAGIAIGTIRPDEF